MNASIEEDYKKMSNAQVCSTCGTKTTGKRYSVSGHGSGAKPSGSRGELREPTKMSPGSGASKAGLKGMTVKQAK